MIVGIDLGTTYSSIAYVNAMGKPEILPNREGEQITPSVVLFQGDMPLVGSMAKRSAAGSPHDYVSLVKRFMGDPDWRFETSSGESHTPETISALIIKRLVEDAELILGEGTVTDAVITPPALSRADQQQLAVSPRSRRGQPSRRQQQRRQAVGSSGSGSCLVYAPRR